MFAEQTNYTPSPSNPTERHPHFSTPIITQIRVTTCRTSSMELPRSTAATSSTVTLTPLSPITLQKRLRLRPPRGTRNLQGQTQQQHRQEAAGIPIAKIATPCHQLLISRTAEHAAELSTTTVGHGATQERYDHGHTYQSHQP